MPDDVGSKNLNSNDRKIDMTDTEILKVIIGMLLVY